jgi:D-3-phosphoglycerate dehydrogenase
VFASVLEVLRDIAGFAKGMRAGDWQRRNQARTHSFELKGLRLGIVGMGAIGQRVAEIGHHGFGMPVQATLMTPRKLPDFVNVVDIDTLAKTSDVLVLCCSLNEATRGLIGAGQLNSMPTGAILVNVARGAVIDEAALLAFASNPDRTVALALDVHHTSPLPQDHPLTHAPLCWLTPHIAGITADSERQMGLMTHRVLNQFFFA